MISAESNVSDPGTGINLLDGHCNRSVSPVIMFLFIVGWLVDLSLHSLPSHRLCIDRIPAWTLSFGLAFGIVTQELVANRLSLLFCPPHGDEFLLNGRWMSRHG